MESENFPNNPNLPELDSCCVVVIGLGYVGLPLAIEFAKPVICSKTGNAINRQVFGFDINKERLKELNDGYDNTNETTEAEFKEASLLKFTSDEDLLANADVFIVTVPTPIDSGNRPNLKPLELASSTVGRALKKRVKIQSVCELNNTLPIVVFESTVYPGTTEEICVPIIENESGLIFNDPNPKSGFVCGYSPERINPGDKNHRLTTIKKITSGSTKAVGKWVDMFYGSIIKAGTHLAPTIKVAEAAKVIENTQRDLNIALINELAIIFNLLDIDTLDVLEAASTKWNFSKYKPGLVGGHCIGVDPYYLTYKAEQVGYNPQIVLAGRRINDGMGAWIVERLVIAMCRKKILVGGANVLILGLTFKENCPDLRNTKVIDIIKSLEKYGMEYTVVDPWADKNEAKKIYGLELINELPERHQYSAIIAAVKHKQFLDVKDDEWKDLMKEECILYDIKGLFNKSLEPIRI